MKPVRLELQGFTAFRAPAVLDFEGRRLFVITGPTGAGKSSLLDAMTWALFGQVPRVGASVGQLIAQGEPSMQVMLEFETRGRRYRVARRVQAKGSSTVRLERRDTAGAWEPIADRTTEVRTQIERLLGMDYTTFTRTMVLPQGAFDAFLRGEPRERREILSRLIGLDVYEAARTIAGARALESKTRAETLRAQLASLDLATPERIATLRAEEAVARERLQALTAREEALRALADCWRAFEAAQRAAASAAREAEQAAQVSGAAQQGLTAAQASAARLQAEMSAAVSGRTALAYDPEAHEDLRTQVSRLEQREAAQRDLDARRAALTVAEREQVSAEGAAAVAVQHAKHAARAADQAATKHDTASAALLDVAASASAARDRAATEAVVQTGVAEEARAAAQEARVRVISLEQVAARLSAGVEAERAAVAAQAEAARQAKAAVREASAAAKSHTAAERALATARTQAEAARRANAAADLSRGLKKGDRCPICGDILTAAPKHARADFDAAERAVAEAERIVREAAAAASAAGTAAAVSAERVEASANALATAAEYRSAIEAEVDRLGVTLAELPRQALREAKAADQAEARALRAEQAAERASAVARSFEVALGSLGETPAGDAVPSASPATVTKAVEAVTATGQSAQIARNAVELATQAADAAQREVALREQVTRAAREYQRDAEVRLEALGVVEGDAAAIRAALLAANEVASRAASLDQEITNARTAFAGAEAATVATQAAFDAARTAEGQRSARLQEARREEQAAATEVEQMWHTVLGEGAPAKATLVVVMKQHQIDQQQATLDAGSRRQSVTHAELQAEQAAASAAEVATQEVRHRLATELSQELRSDRFIDHLVREHLELLARDASQRLMQFSTGRYELATEKGDFFVLDHQNGDERRSVKTLSGGETFLASLALALSLSEHLPEISGTGGAVSLESLFLDEGFGSLDAESLDLAVQGLEALVDGNRMVGVISHVEELSERLPSRIHVEKGTDSSRIRADAR